MKTRLYFLDNLRTFLIFLVVLLHAGIVYEPILENVWIVSDPDKCNEIGLIRMYLDIFVMFIMFYISGYFIRDSVKGKTAWSFLKSKFNRIMIPWIVAVFTLIPAYKVIFLWSRGMMQEEWFSYFHIFTRNAADLSYYADNPTQSWLWFLPVLFLFQVVYFGLSRTNLFSVKISLKTGVLLTFVIGLAYSLVISSTGLLGWFNSPLLHFQRERLLIYFMGFLLGALSNKLNIFESEKKNRKYYILSNVVLTVSLGIFTATALNLFFNMIDPGRNYFFVSEWVDKVAYYVSMLLSMLSFLHISVYVFRFSFNKTSRLASELAKNSYAVYIIHLVVMGLIALPLLNLHIPAFVKFLILTTTTFVVSNAVVSAYRIAFQKTFSSGALRVAVPIAAILLSIAIYASQGVPSMDNAEPKVTHTKVSAPAIGLHMAVIQGNIEVVKQHIAAGTDRDQKEPSGGSSPLITAALFGKTDIAMALIEAGADVNFKNNDGSTPLHSAAFFCQTEIVEALLANGADKSLKNNAGSTAFESVAAPFDAVKGIYDYFGSTLGPLGLELDYDQIKTTRPIIAEMLK